MAVAVRAGLSELLAWDRAREGDTSDDVETADVSDPGGIGHSGVGPGLPHDRPATRVAGARAAAGATATGSAPAGRASGATAAPGLWRPGIGVRLVGFGQGEARPGSGRVIRAGQG